ncbi:MAG: mechanosensitive ion channel [Xanthomonadales bacterium]|nr:mechanosensitive ion channel [Xanthomonadales bacterium]
MPFKHQKARSKSYACHFRYFLTATLASVFVFSWSMTALAQLPVQLPQQPQEESAAPKWQPPDLVELPAEWWDEFDTISADVARQRFDMFLTAVEQRIDGLDAESLVAAQNARGNLENLIDLLQVAKQADAEIEFEPVLTQETYDLDALLALQSQLRDAENERAQLSLQIAQTERQQELLIQQRNNLLRQYQSTAKESPQRIIAGLRRVAARVEYELSLKRVENLEQELESIRDYQQRVTEQKEYALENLDGSGADLEDLAARVEAAYTRISDTSQNVAAVQKQLLNALSAESVKSSLELLRKQQLTRASVEASLAQLEAALIERQSSWYQFRAGELESSYDQDKAATDAQGLIEETLEQIDVWSAQSQSTLVSRPSDNSLNTIKNFELAQTVARETLESIEQIRAISDDLRLIQEVLTTELINSRSGLSKAWAKFKLTTASGWRAIKGAIDYELFSIGEVPVTPGGLFKAFLIILIAYAISRVIRHLLDHATGQAKFSNSPAIYTLGRLLHYIIMLIGVFAALGSIGMDFTNFALIAGALSVGIGFGLQAIVNNFVSGLILLFEGSLRIGDYIELDSGLAGVVKEINTRATIVNSNDGVDVVVPNSELVTTKLTNWTLRENMGRLRIPFGVAYGTDKELVKEAALEAANDMEFILLHDKGREPQVRLVNFGDSALEFELLAWVSRPGIRRPHRVRASFLWALETKLTEAGIEIPFPQRDVHIKRKARLLAKVKLESEDMDDDGESAGDAKPGEPKPAST